MSGTGSNLKIVEKTSDYTAYNVAAMLTMTPLAWAEPTFGGHVQLGVTPKKDEIALYLGAGIDLQQMISIGIGVVAQQVQVLGPGLSVGQAVDSADALKTDRRFRLGPYLHLTLRVSK